MNQDQQQPNGHTPESNVPTEDEEGVVLEEDEISEEPSTGEDFEARRTETPDEAEVLPGPAEEAAVHRVLADPGINLTAPDTTMLRDIAEASFGPPPHAAGNPTPAVEEASASASRTGLATPEVVIGTDDRIQIHNTATYPWRVHASLLITARDNSAWIGTAWYISPRTLATAGHCVFINAPGTARHGWVRSIQVMPGRNGSALPYGSITSTSFRSVTGWTQNADPNFDYGAILTPATLGVGWFGFGVYSDANLRSTTAHLSGYPGDKPAGTQWYHWRQVASVSSRRVFYTIDTAGGQSGSAVYRIRDGNRYGIAIHAYGAPTANSGTRIVRPVFDNLVAWRT